MAVEGRLLAEALSYKYDATRLQAPKKHKLRLAATPQHNIQCCTEYAFFGMPLPTVPIHKPQVQSKSPEAFTLLYKEAQET